MSGSHDPSSPTRRAFLQRTTTTAAAAAGVFSVLSRAARADAAAPLKLGLVGCGRRGTGAVMNALDADPNVTLVAMGDLFPDQMAKAREKFAARADRVKVTDETCFTGFDAGAKVAACDVDVVMLCDPPGFRPAHFQAAVEAGRHVFMEKPGAVCPAGVRSVLATAALADQKGLCVVAGTQRRHQKPYQEVIKRIQDGAVGDIVSASCYWIGDFDYYPAVLRQDGWSDVEAQIRNWNYHAWLSGDHIVEQHLHNIDVIHWVLGQNPVKCLGMGGRQQRTGPEFGHIFDHFAVEFEYSGGVLVQSLCRQMKGTENRVNEHVAGTKGTAVPGNSIRGGKKPYTFRGDASDPYVQEHADLYAAIRSGIRINEAHALAHSTLAAVMGRMSAYTGQTVTWDFALNQSTLDLMPKNLAFGDLPQAPMAMPGVTPLV